MSKDSTALRLTRRGFIAASGAVAVGAMVGCGTSGSGPATETSVLELPGARRGKAYRFSTRDVGSASNAAKSHAANLLYVAPGSAERDRAHPGDKSKIVCVDIKPTNWERWFGGPNNTQVDLRKI